MSTVIVLSGGISDEREVSLRSGQAVCEALQKSGHDALNIDFKGDLGDWATPLGPNDVVFPVLHGAGGEDGQVQKLLEKESLHFVGSDSESSSLCFDKWRYKQLALANDFVVPRGELVDLAGFNGSALAGKPFVIKPHNGGSSVDTIITRDISKLDKASIETLFNKYPKMLLEELIDGVEITVGILGDEALPLVEIIPPEFGEFDYENKYNGATRELCPPENVSQAVQQKAQKIALDIHNLCGCRDLSRSDFIITPDEKIYLLETNTLPGMTEQSLFPRAALAAGLPMSDLCGKLVNMALARG